jgi:hypothetical protein
MPCLQCEAEKAERRYLIAEADLRDDLTFALECPSGHKTRLIFEAQKFEVLFDMGSLALLDGYDREAVSSFAAAQERFHEFCIKVFLAASGIPREAFAPTWKLVSNQSERQIGAYYFLKLTFFKTPIGKKEAARIQEMTAFRNNVIHKGYIPTKEETKEYAAYAYDYIVGSLGTMKPALDDHIDVVCKADLDDLKASIPAGMLTRSGKVPTMIWLAAPADKFGKRSFEDALKARKEDHLLELQERVNDLEQEIEDDEEEDEGD